MLEIDFELGNVVFEASSCGKFLSPYPVLEDMTVYISKQLKHMLG